MVLDYENRQRLTRQMCMDLNALDIIAIPGVMAALQQHWWEHLQEAYRDELETRDD